MKKYYTPNIEEFHIRFEYEEFIKGKGWTKRIVNNLEDVGINKDNVVLDWDDYRVKYLDQEDIQNLKFKRDKLRAFQLTEQLYNKDNIMLMYNNKLNEISIATRDPSKSDYYSKYNRDPQKVNNIHIKNKSELKVLFKQLNIK